MVNSLTTWTQRKDINPCKTDWLVWPDLKTWWWNYKSDEEMIFRLFENLIFSNNNDCYFLCKLLITDLPLLTLNCCWVFLYREKLSIWNKSCQSIKISKVSFIFILCLNFCTKLSKNIIHLFNVGKNTNKYEEGKKFGKVRELSNIET